MCPRTRTSSAAINLMAEHRMSYRKRRYFKLDVIPTTFSASNVRRIPKTKSRQTTVISKTKRAASKAAVTLEKLVRDKALCKDIRKLSTQYQTSSIEPSTASIALLSTLHQRSEYPKFRHGAEEQVLVRVRLVSRGNRLDLAVV
ncbi:hypothetical protein LSAT2_003104 [Lamellibrachia satsuma]|nr:hypothetical protein LSAT2_003104 [Lamellibrachia satsuma]